MRRVSSAAIRSTDRERLDRARRQIAQVADRRAHQIERARHDPMVAGCAVPGHARRSTDWRTITRTTRGRRSRKKLGIKEGSRVFLVNPPDGFDRLLIPMPDGATLVAKVAKPLDVGVLFATERAEMTRWFDPMASSLDTSGRLWVAWPKKASKVATDIDFGFAQGIGLDFGLVDNKSASITDVFQGLQFVYRVKDRPKR